MWWTKNPRLKATDILQHNDRGPILCRPTGFILFNLIGIQPLRLGYRLHSPERAFSEIILLLSAQWADGMIPHIFRGDHEGYFSRT